MGKNRPYFVHRDTDPDVLKHVQDVEKGLVVDPDLPPNEATNLLNHAEVDREQRQESRYGYPMFPEVLDKDVLENYKDQIREERLANGKDHERTA
jgi:hypothetical protein